MSDCDDSRPARHRQSQPTPPQPSPPRPHRRQDLAAQQTSVPRAAPRRIVLISASIGAGHDGAARELARRLGARGFAVECHDFLDLLPRGWGHLLKEGYAQDLRFAPWAWGWGLGHLERHPWSIALERALFGRTAGTRVLQAIGPDPAAVVSTFPLASQTLGRLRRLGRLAAPVATFLTDMSVHPIWVEPGVDLHMALHAIPAAQARVHGAATALVCGAAVDPAFRPARSAAERSAERASFGLPLDRPVALVVAGSWGAGQAEATAREIAASALAVPVTVCGRNQALRRRLASAGLGVAMGWVDNMPALIRASDVVVQNAGGLTSLEALTTGVPVVSYRCLPGHGTTNAAALEQAAIAAWIRTADQLEPTLRTVLQTGSASCAIPAADIPPEQIIETLACTPQPWHAMPPSAAPPPLRRPRPRLGTETVQ